MGRHRIARRNSQKLLVVLWVRNLNLVNISFYPMQMLIINKNWFAKLTSDSSGSVWAGDSVWVVAMACESASETSKG